MAYLERSIAASAGIPDVTLGVPLADALTVHGVLLMDIGQSDAAASAFHRALAIARATGDRHGEADIINDLGLLASYQGEVDTAHHLQEQALMIRREIGNWQRIALSYINLADLAMDRGDLTEALRILTLSHDAGERAGDQSAVGAALLGRAEILGDRGRRRASEQLLARSRAIFRDKGDVFSLGFVAEVEGWLALRRGRARVALEQYQLCLRYWQTSRNRRGQVGAVEGVALSLLAAGMPGSAAIMLHDCDALRRRERIGRSERRQQAIDTANRQLLESNASWKSLTGTVSRLPVQLDELVAVALGARIDRPPVRRARSPRSPVRATRRIRNGLAPAV